MKFTLQLVTLFWFACGPVVVARGQLTAFTYQGRLSDAAGPANGTYEFEFTLWDSLSAGTAASAAVLGTAGGVGVTNGLFTVILDFGSGALNGAPRWIQLGVRTNGSVAAFSVVTPRQAIPVAPYAVFATTASNVVAGAVGNAALAANAVTADKIAGAAVVKGINNLKDAVTIQAGSNLVVSTTGNTITLSGTTGPAWGLNGNTGIGTTNFLGTTDQKALDLRVGGVRALRLEPNSSGLPNMIGGHANNAVAAGVLSAVIAGGGDPGAGASNSVASSYGTVGGGLRNAIRTGANGGVVAGGVGNVVEAGSYGVISGGAYNLVQAAQSSVVGGYNNIIQSNAVNSAVLSGANNLIANTATYVVIAGGDRNLIGPGSSHANVAGGLQNTNLAVRSTIGGGSLNTILSNSFDSVITGGRQNTVQSNMSYGTILGGLRNTLQTGATYSSVVGGLENVIQTNSTVGAILGGYQNVIQTNVSSGIIAGGSYHVISNNANFGTIVGGAQNAVAGSYALAAGYRAKAIHSGSFVWSDPTGGDLATTGTNQFLIRATGGVGIGTATPASLLHVLGTVTATNFAGSGAGLSNLPPTSLTGVLAAGQIPSLDGSKLTSGTVTDARLSANVALLNTAPSFTGAVTATGFNGSGANLSGLNANNLAAGTLADARLSANVALLNGTNVFAGTNRFAGVAVATNVNNQFTGAFTGNGAGLTNLAVPAGNVVGTLAAGQIPNLDAAKITTGTFTAGQIPGLDAAKITTGTFTAAQIPDLDGSKLSSGTVTDARLSANVALLNTAPSFTGAVTAAGFNGSGANLTSLNANNLAAGTLADARLSANVALLNGTNVFAGTNRFAGVAIATNVNNQFTGAFTGNGAGLSGVPGALPYQTVVGTAQTAAPNTAYLLTNSALTTVTLPVAPLPGDVVRVIGYGAGGWRVVPNGGQVIDATGMAGSVETSAWAVRENNRQWISVTSSTDGSILAAVESGGQIYLSTNSGITWTARGPAGSWVSIAMSGDGSKLVAAMNGGQLYTSVDSGVTWTPRDNTRDWLSVTSSSDGTKLAAVVFFGQIYTSADSGVTWLARETSRQWQAIASSADGATLVALEFFGRIHVSTDGGATWTPRESSQAWTAVASSADGTKLLAAVEGGRLYTSTDTGATWSPRESERSWKSVAASADGSRMAAVDNGGQVYLSNDSGVSWVSHESERPWAAIALSGNGARVFAAEAGGRLYVPLPSSITGGGGFLSGTQRTLVELLCVGGGVFLPTFQQGTFSAQ